jgi:hypothetical protein
MLGDFDRTRQLLDGNIAAEEERARISDRSDAKYPILARTLIERRDNLIVTVAVLAERLHAINATIPAAIPEAAWSTIGAGPKPRGDSRKAAGGYWP